MNNDNIRRTCPIGLIFGQQVAKYTKEKNKNISKKQHIDSNKQ